MCIFELSRHERARQKDIRVLSRTRLQYVRHLVSWGATATAAHDRTGAQDPVSAPHCQSARHGQARVHTLLAAQKRLQFRNLVIEPLLMATTPSRGPSPGPPWGGGALQC